MKRSLVLIIAVLISGAVFSQKPVAVDLTKSMKAGLEIYSTNCQSCHMENGEGIEDTYPPLASSDYMMADKNRLIKLILNGSSEPMVVNGKTYQGYMPGYPLNDQEVSDLINFIRNSFENKGGVTTPAEVAAARKN
jgi:nitrite reductase (NO-forming)